MPEKNKFDGHDINEASLPILKKCKKSQSSESILLKREQEFATAKKALEAARHKRAIELGNLCLDFGFHTQPIGLLRQKFSDLAKALSKKGDA